MADTKITEFDGTPYASGNDLLVIVTNTNFTPSTESITVFDFFGNVSANTTFNSNVTFSQNTIVMSGNSLIYYNINSSIITFSNSTTQATLGFNGLDVNSIAIVNSIGVFVGANQVINSSVYFSGNATSNLLVNSTLLTFSNDSPAIANLDITGLYLSGLVVNTSGFFINNNFLSINGLNIGNSSVNIASNSSLFSISSSTNTVSISSKILTIADSNNNIVINTKTIFIGNSTVNALINTSSISLINASANIIIAIPDPTSLFPPAVNNIFLHANGSWTGVQEYLIFDISRSDSVVVNTSITFNYITPFSFRFVETPRATLVTNSSSGNVVIDVSRNGISVLATPVNILTNQAIDDSTSTFIGGGNTFTVGDSVSFLVSNAGTSSAGLKVHVQIQRKS